MATPEKPMWDEKFMPPGVQFPLPGAEVEPVEIEKKRRPKTVNPEEQLEEQPVPDKLFEPGSIVEAASEPIDPDAQELKEITERARRYVRPPRRPYRARYKDSTNNSVRQLKD